jgi:hypothetical protein
MTVHWRTFENRLWPGLWCSLCIWGGVMLWLLLVFGFLMAMLFGM